MILIIHLYIFCHKASLLFYKLFPCSFLAYFIPFFPRFFSLSTLQCYFRIVSTCSPYRISIAYHMYATVILVSSVLTFSIYFSLSCRNILFAFFPALFFLPRVCLGVACSTSLPQKQLDCVLVCYTYRGTDTTYDIIIPFKHSCTDFQVTSICSHQIAFCLCVNVNILYLT